MELYLSLICPSHLKDIPFNPSKKLKMYPLRRKIPLKTSLKIHLIGQYIVYLVNLVWTLSSPKFYSTLFLKSRNHYQKLSSLKFRNNFPQKLRGKMCQSRLRNGITNHQSMKLKNKRYHNSSMGKHIRLLDYI